MPTAQRPRGLRHRVGCGIAQNAHDAGEAPAAQRALARIPPEPLRALHAETAVPALEKDGILRPITAHDAQSVVLVMVGLISVRLDFGDALIH